MLLVDAFQTRDAPLWGPGKLLPSSAINSTIMISNKDLHCGAEEIRTPGLFRAREFRHGLAEAGATSLDVPLSTSTHNTISLVFSWVD